MNGRETSTDYRRPHRPRPVALANAALARVPRRSRLETGELIEAATRRAGLSELGDPSFLAPFEVLVRSIEREARLHPLGRFITRERLIGILVNRLRVERARRAAGEAPIEGPIVITGLQRTGTTLLHRVLASDPRLRWLASWEALHPAPVDGLDHRVKNAARAQRALAYLAPDFFAIHPVEALAPEEDVLLLDYAFRSTVPESTLRVPTYASWLESQDQTPAYRYMATLLRVLSAQRGAGKRWLLKTPHHLEWLDVLFAVFPGTKVVWTHRDPAITVASFCSMIAHGRGVFSDEIDPIEIGRSLERKLGRAIDRAMDTRESSPEGTFLDVRYEDLVRAPMEEVRRIYRFLGTDLPLGVERAMERTIHASPQHRHGTHRYTLEDFGLSVRSIHTRFARYREAYLRA